MDWIGLDWIGLDWIGLDWIGLDWIGLDWIGLDWIGLDWINVLWVNLILSTVGSTYRGPKILDSTRAQTTLNVSLVWALKTFNRMNKISNQFVLLTVNLI